jgi:GDP-4-dehydro-6-deoxy-D-mannose reductase
MSPTHNSQLTTSLITGINGFVGKYLTTDLLSRRRRVVGIDLQKNSPLSDIDYFSADIRDADLLSQIIKKTQPSEIYHLAGISYPPQFNTDQYPCFQINILGSVALLDAIKNNCPRSVVLMIGSSKEYRRRNDRALISEQIPLDPSSFYGISKYFSEIIGRRYALTYGLDIRFTRSFNHSGPGQSPQFVCSDWARQIALITSNKAQPQLSIGNINEVIDFTDVRDIVEAYRLILEKGNKGEAYNVCSGKGISLKYILDYLIAKSTSIISVVEQKEKIEVHGNSEEFIGDNRKIIGDTGWSPKIPIEKTLDDLYNWWLTEIKKT